MLELETAESIREQVSQKAQGHLEQKMQKKQMGEGRTRSAAVLFGLDVVLL